MQNYFKFILVRKIVMKLYMEIEKGIDIKDKSLEKVVYSQEEQLNENY